MLIREFSLGDEPHLAEVFYQAIHQTAAADYGPEQLAVWAPAQHDPNRWAERMRGIRPFVAELDGVIVGYADLQTDGYIDHFFVSPEAGRRGVGAALMQHILEVARAKRMTRLYSEVSLTARPFFEKFHFIVDEAQVVLISGVALNNFRMSKLLGST
ncbi:MAG: family N-acetyltransferase [Planctomycetaceae bacterium]|nr:family N-acetyltransferase [Planctomycetaceae bacterium]